MFETVIKFESEEARDEFNGWMCDGGGEYQFMDAMDMRGCKSPVKRVEYTGNTEIIMKE